MATRSDLAQDKDTSNYYSQSPTGAVLYLPMSQSTGDYGVAFTPDYSGAGNDGTVSGAVYQAVAGGGYWFDGTNDYMDCGNGSSLQITEAITMSTWMKGGIGNTRIISKDDGGANRSYISYVGATGIPNIGYWLSGSFKSLAAISVVTNGTWHHVCANIDAVGMRIYVDGVLENTNALGGAIDNDSANLEIGRKGDGTQYFWGNIDEPSVFNRAFTAQEVRDAFAIGTRLHEPIPAYYRNSQMYMPFNVSNATETVDQSYYAMKNWPGNTGTVSGATWTSASEGYWFDGTNDYIDLGQSTSLDVTELTAAAWVKFDSADEETIIGADDGTDRNWALYMTTANNLRWLFFIDGAAKVIDRAFTPSASTWYHVAGTFDGSQAGVYVDGLLIGTNVFYSGAIDTDDVKTYIGWDGNATHNKMDGSIDDPVIYSTALTSNQVYTLSQQAH